MIYIVIYLKFIKLGIGIWIIFLVNIKALKWNDLYAGDSRRNTQELWIHLGINAQWINIL